jgi:hypothetical protein
MPAIFWSRAVLSSRASISSRQISACSMAARARMTLKRSIPVSILPLRRIPAVSMISTSRSWYLTMARLTSRVVPALSATMACCFLARVLNRLDLPTFGRPSSAMRRRLSSSSC